jgi:GxxExxY protein
VGELIDQHEAQVINYLNAGDFELGILVNFGAHPKLEYKRLALSKEGARG